MPDPPSPRRGSGLTAKVGGIPVWGLLAGGVGLGALWFLSKRSKANQAAQASVTSPASTGGLVPGQSSLQPILFNLGQPSSTTPSTATGTTGVGKMLGSGYDAATPGGSVTSSQGTFTSLTGASFGPAVSSGIGTYWQPSPGVFVPSSGPSVIDPNTGVQAKLGSNPYGLAPGTPQFIRNQ